MKELTGKMKYLIYSIYTCACEDPLLGVIRHGSLAHRFHSKQRGRRAQMDFRVAIGKPSGDRGEKFWEVVEDIVRGGRKICPGGCPVGLPMGSARRKRVRMTVKH